MTDRLVIEGGCFKKQKNVIANGNDFQQIIGNDSFSCHGEERNNPEKKHSVLLKDKVFAMTEKRTYETHPDETNEKRILFCIASHIMEVLMPDTLDWERLLPSFKLFKVETADEKSAICSVRAIEQPIPVVPDSAKLLYEVSNQFGYLYCLLETEQKYISDVQFVENGNHYQMISDKNFSTSTVYVDWNEEFAGTVLSSFLMIAFAQSAVLHKTLLIHASVVEKDGYGYAFLGKSGTGKSTHSALWLRYIEDTTLLNDDNPVIRIEEDGSVYVYGTPWSGKTPCYNNRRVLLNALVRLQQAASNRFVWQQGVNALITLLPSCSSMRWNTLLYDEMCSNLEKVVSSVKIACLACLPNRDAALLCYEEIKNVNENNL